jgi:hypothetical protein
MHDSAMAAVAAFVSMQLHLGDGGSGSWSTAIFAGILAFLGTALQRILAARHKAQKESSETQIKTKQMLIDALNENAEKLHLADAERIAAMENERLAMVRKQAACEAENKFLRKRLKRSLNTQDFIAVSDEADRTRARHMSTPPPDDPFPTEDSSV